MYQTLALVENVSLKIFLETRQTLKACYFLIIGPRDFQQLVLKIWPKMWIFVNVIDIFRLPKFAAGQYASVDLNLAPLWPSVQKIWPKMGICEEKQPVAAILKIVSTFLDTQNL